MLYLPILRRAIQRVRAEILELKKQKALVPTGRTRLQRVSYDAGIRRINKKIGRVCKKLRPLKKRLALVKSLGN